MSVTEVLPIDTSNSYVAEIECSDVNNVQKESTLKSSQRCALSDRTARVLEVVILTVVIVIVMALLSLPTALHFVTKVRPCLHVQYSSVYILTCSRMSRLLTCIKISYIA